MTPTPIQGADCGDASGNALCTRPAGHPGAHYDATVGLTWTADAPPAGLLPRVDELTARIRELSTKFTELVRLAAPSDGDALNLGPIIERQRLATNDQHFHSDIAASQADVLPLVREVMRLRREGLQLRTAPMPDATLRSAVAGFERALHSMTNVWHELLSATCTGCPEVALSSDIEPRPDCPVHGEVAELRRQIEWATQLHEQFCAALGPEFVGPFSADPTSAILRSIDTARKLDGVLREAGIEHPLGLRGVEDLVSQRDGALECASERRDAVRAAIVATVHQGHSANLDDCTHHACGELRDAVGRDR